MHWDEILAPCSNLLQKLLVLQRACRQPARAVPLCLVRAEGTGCALLCCPLGCAGSRCWCLSQRRAKFPLHGPCGRLVLCVTVEIKPGYPGWEYGLLFSVRSENKAPATAPVPPSQTGPAMISLIISESSSSVLSGGDAVAATSSLACSLQSSRGVVMAVVTNLHQNDCTNANGLGI